MISACSDIDGSVLTVVFLTTYGVIIGSIAACGRFLGKRLHEFATECALERHRQNEMFERLLMTSFETESDEPEVDFLATEQPASNTA